MTWENSTPPSGKRDFQPRARSRVAFSPSPMFRDNPLNSRELGVRPYLPSVFVCVLTRAFSRVAFLPSPMFVTTSWPQPPLQHAPFTPAPAHLLPAAIPISPRNSLPSLAFISTLQYTPPSTGCDPPHSSCPAKELVLFLCHPLHSSRPREPPHLRKQLLNVPLTGDSASPLP